MPNSNEYMREYMLARYHARRAWAIELLGGKCVVCGATSDLEIDHKDRKTKSVSIAKLNSYSLEVLKTELTKCQLLCYTCHQVKTSSERAEALRHGTISMYKYKCRCDECRKAQSEYKKNLRARSSMARASDF